MGQRGKRRSAAKAMSEASLQSRRPMAETDPSARVRRPASTLSSRQAAASGPTTTIVGWVGQNSRMCAASEAARPPVPIVDVRRAGGMVPV
jgi:hypothetical protein